MIPASKNMNFTQIPPGLTEQLAHTLAAPGPAIETATAVKETPAQPVLPEPQEKHQAEMDVPDGTASIKTVTKTEAGQKKKQDRNGQINICVPPEIKTAWKLLFTANNVTMTQGIIFAIEHLKHEIDCGEAVLTVGGVISRHS